VVEHGCVEHHGVVVMQGEDCLLRGLGRGWVGLLDLMKCLLRLRDEISDRKCKSRVNELKSEMLPIRSKGRLFNTYTHTTLSLRHTIGSVRRD
jgi:hypothetical protein